MEESISRKDVISRLHKLRESFRVKVTREAGYGGQFEGYGPQMTEKTASECAMELSALIIDLEEE